jgi:hypothetical protein
MVGILYIPKIRFAIKTLAYITVESRSVYELAGAGLAFLSHMHS